MSKFTNDPLFVTRSAKFSDDRAYRFFLDIVWDVSKPMAAFIGLNPSTADELVDDPTIRRCRGFAESWGCGGMRMLNLFAFRATRPKDMLAAADPVGEGNDLDYFLTDVTGPRVACWGRDGRHLDRGTLVGSTVKHLQCFGRNSDGSPKHPLYLLGSTKLQAFG